MSFTGPYCLVVLMTCCWMLLADHDPHVHRERRWWVSLAHV